MADTAPKAKQRFLSLDVDEVSLVDRPANTESFVVTKSLTSEAPVADQTQDRSVQMEAALAEQAVIKEVIGTLDLFNKGLKDGKPPSKDGDKPYDQEGMMKKLQSLCSQKAMPADLKAKLEKFIAKAFPPKPKDEKEPGEKTNPAKAKKDDDADDEDAEKAAGAKDEEAPKAKKEKAKAPGAGKDPAVDGASPDLAKAKKGVGDGVGDPQVELVHTLLMAAVGSIQKASMLVDMELSDLDGVAVEKGLKQFSAARVDALKKAAKQMVDLLKELSPAHLKDLGMGVADAAETAENAAVGANADGASGEPGKPVTPTTSPAGKNPPNEPDGPAQGDSSPLDTSAVANAIKKALEDAMAPVIKQLEAASKANAALQEKVNKMEAVRGVSKALTDEGNDKPVEKKSSLFAGVV